jgi:hypothetical protein
MTLRRYSGCKGFNVRAQLPLEYWYLKELQHESKEEVWLAVAPDRGNMLGRLFPFLRFEDKDNILYPSDDGRLNINMKVKLAQRDTPRYPGGTLPHLTYEEVGKDQKKIVELDGYSRLECIGEDGEVKCYLKSGDPWQRKTCEWVEGPDNSKYGDFGWLVYVDYYSGMHNSSWPIGFLNFDNYRSINGILNLPMPLTTGYLRWTIDKVDIRNFLYSSYTDDLWALLINNVEITTTDASGPSM